MNHAYQVFKCEYIGGETVYYYQEIKINLAFDY